MSANLQTIARFSDPVEAELACARLRDEGLNAVVTGHELGNLFAPGYSIGGLNLLVPAEECERAEEVLKDLVDEIDARKHRPKEAITADPPPLEPEEIPDEVEAHPHTADEMVERAFRASLFGFFIFTPMLPVGHVYAILMLLKVTFGDEPTSAGYTAKYYIAFFLSAVSVTGGALFMIMTLGLLGVGMQLAVVVGVVMFVYSVPPSQRPNAP